MASQIPVPSSAVSEREENGIFEITADVAYQRLGLVNVIFFGRKGAPTHDWVLIDAGLPGTAARIREGMKHRFGDLAARPAAIILTHGHFDHVGALRTLSEEWSVPIYAHELEFPYLDGRSAYAPPDPTVGGGIMAAMAGLYPRGPVDVTQWLRRLPPDGTVPHMPGWRWLATPGHTPGHVSLWRESDRTLIAGDAFITTKQESAFAVFKQRPELHGPPMYYTQDWERARNSVRKLAALGPERVITGHGPAMAGPEMKSALNRLARHFDDVAVPGKGRYADDPALADSTGTVYVPLPKKAALPFLSGRPTFKGWIAGLLATIPMTLAFKLLNRRVPRPLRLSLPPEEVTLKLAHKIGADQRLRTAAQRKAAIWSGHYLYGATAGTLYPALADVVARKARIHPAVTGAAFGLTVWAGSYMGWLPGLRILPPETKRPRSRRVLNIAAHLVWGVALGLIASRLNRKKPA